MNLRAAALPLVLMTLPLAACGEPPSGEEAVGSTQSAVTANEQAAYNYFVARGLTDFQAAGIVGNLQQESSVVPTAVQYGGGPGRGIAQWSVGGRWDADGGDNAVWFASTQNADVWSLDLQLSFIWYELTTFPGYGLGTLRASTDVVQATIAFENLFEGCGTCDQSSRIAYAEDVLAAYGGSNPQPQPPPSYYYRGMARDASGRGYWIVGSDGGVFTYGDAGFHGSAGGSKLNAQVVAMASTPDGQGYWLAAADGGVFTYGDAGFHGSAGAVHLNAPVVGIAPTPSGNGYWLVAADGGVFTYGDGAYHGSMGGTRLNAPMVGMAATPSGNGYWLVAADGGIFAFGDAGFHGSAGAIHLDAPVVGMAATPSGNGYWLVAADGGIFAYGDATFHGSMGGKPLDAPIVGMAATPDGQGYWLVAGDGGIFTFGDAPFAGSRG